MSMDNNEAAPSASESQPQLPPQGGREEPQVTVVAPRKSHKPLIAISIATAAVIGIGGLGTAGFALLTRPSTTTTSSTQSSPSRDPFGSYRQQYGQGFPGTSPRQGGGSFGSGTSTQTAATASTASQQVGVVTINTVLDYDTSEQAAGTGMILTAGGLILTNNHVVEGATSITVTVESTGQTYTARVVGTDQKQDVAVLQLADASGLSTVSFAPNAAVSAGQAVYSVGNAEGTGDLVTAVGTVAATNQSLSLPADSTTKAESLTGLIELDSDVVSGDSGGPLFDKSGDVIGIVTAASSGTADVTGYAINIKQVLAVVDQIEAGTATADIVIGTPAFLGIELSDDVATTDGVAVSGTFPGMPAALAGITAGSTITAVNGVPVTTATELSSVIARHAVGDRLSVSWTDSSGAAHTATVTLVGGPAA
ncbi:MAG TPA: trypsin-like peptidase domain-containing protein [Galbitalea sp.]|jgi:S1-C subfamily serine protease